MDFVLWVLQENTQVQIGCEFILQKVKLKSKIQHTKDPGN